MDFITYVTNFFKARGWTTEQAQGIAGNLYVESAGGNPGAIGDGGAAYGLAQWHPDRQSLFQRVFGKSIVGSSLDDQLAFVDYELKNVANNGGALLQLQTTVEDATATFMRLFERPANMSSLGARINAAKGNVVGNASGSFGDNLGNALGSIPTPWNPLGGLFPNNPLNPLSWFSSDLAGRVVAVVIGVVFIGLAIAAFALKSDTVQTVIADVKP